MTEFELQQTIQTIKFWTNTITLGLTRLAIILACWKFIRLE